MSSIGTARRNSDAPSARGAHPGGAKQGAPQRTAPANMPPSRTWGWLALLVLANYVIMRLFVPAQEGPITVPYTIFKEEVAKKNVRSIFSRGETINGRFATPVTYVPPEPDGAAASASRSAMVTSEPSLFHSTVTPRRKWRSATSEATSAASRTASSRSEGFSMR